MGVYCRICPLSVHGEPKLGQLYLYIIAFLLPVNICFHLSEVLVIIRDRLLMVSELNPETDYLISAVLMPGFVFEKVIGVTSRIPTSCRSWRLSVLTKQRHR